jgi:hypothetical protein
LLSKGVATVGDKTVEAVLVRNIYGQEIVWGMFGHDRGKFKGFLANNASTQRVNYSSDCGKHTVRYSPPFGDFDEKDPIPTLPAAYTVSRKWLKDKYKL